MKQNQGVRSTASMTSSNFNYITKDQRNYNNPISERHALTSAGNQSRRS